MHAAPVLCARVCNNGVTTIFKNWPTLFTDETPTKSSVFSIGSEKDNEERCANAGMQFLGTVM